jgi:hypothetical protein
MFGCSDWRGADELSGLGRKNFSHELYRDQLRNAAGALYIWSARMIEARFSAHAWRYEILNFRA